MIEKEDFTRLYKPFFQLHPFKKRDWPDGLGEVHYKAFCRDSPALMQEAMGLLVEKLDHFPTPRTYGRRSPHSVHQRVRATKVRPTAPASARKSGVATSSTSMG